jgi:ribosomal protein S11
VKAQDTAQIEKTEKPAEKLKNFSKKGVAISYFACYNNTCVTATDMR